MGLSPLLTLTSLADGGMDSPSAGPGSEAHALSAAADDARCVRACARGERVQGEGLARLLFQGVTYPSRSENKGAMI